jgi:LAS superfamily LD-carboxypeptidase LdcB
VSSEPWSDLYPVVEHTIYVFGVPSRAQLVEIQPGQYLARDAAMAFAKMHHAAAADGIVLKIRSGWRSHEHQARLRGEWERGERKLRPMRPGWSLHESGKAADILRSHDDPDAGGPLVGPTDKWLKTNARRFGFCRTVPAELWHWEYLGEHGVIR